VLSPKELALTNGAQPANGNGPTPISTTKPAEPVELPEDGSTDS
jgi:cell division protease FtsH